MRELSEGWNYGRKVDGEEFKMFETSEREERDLINHVQNGKMNPIMICIPTINAFSSKGKRISTKFSALTNGVSQIKIKNKKLNLNITFPFIILYHHWKNFFISP